MEKLMVDKIDEAIISGLGQNSRQTTFELWDFLKGFGYNISQEEIESRIAVLEDEALSKTILFQ